MPSSKRLRKQKAKIEFAVCKETIFALLAQDFSPKLIHEQLVEEGRISMAYPSFTQILRNEQREAVKSEKPKTLSAHNDNRPARPPRVPGIIKSPVEQFPDPRKMNLEDGI